MARLDFERAAAFIAAIPPGRWTAYGDVAEAGGSPRGAQAVGDWLRRKGDEVPHVYRVLNVQGLVPEAFHPAGPGVPKDAPSVREVLRREGISIDASGRASQSQRFRVSDWT
jgi:alkylated DNA nucleotide flippase Atl1